jgi:hypothetical protein
MTIQKPGENMIHQFALTCLLAITYLLVTPARLTPVHPGSLLEPAHAALPTSTGLPCLNVKDFVVFMDSLANWRTTTGRESAWAVRSGLQAAGLNVEKHPYYAKDYGPFLVHLGFTQIPDDSPPSPGDIMILQPGLNPSGHVQVWNGSRWVSDFMQPANRGGYQGKGYRDIDAPHVLYRYPSPCQ